ncbi:putative reverse transcriptase domain-containing protein [Tanacetum coccineum]
MLDAFTSFMCVESWGRVSFARALIEVSADFDLKNEVIMAVPNEKGNGYTKEVIRVEYEWKPPHCMDCKIFGHSYDTCLKNVNKSKPSVSSMDDQSDGFTEVKRKKNKGSKDNKNPNSRNFGGFWSTKPKPNSYRPKKVPEPSQGKQVKPNSNPFNALHSLGEEDSGEAPNPPCATKHGEGNGKFKSPTGGAPETIHYFERHDVADMDHVVETLEHENDGGVSKHISSSWNEDSESDDEVDEVLFPEGNKLGDQFHIRLNYRNSRTKPDKQDTSSSSGNYTTQAVDADIGPVNDEEPFAEKAVGVILHKLVENVDLKAQIQEKVFANAALNNELRKLKGNIVDSKFTKASILGKPPLQPS